MRATRPSLISPLLAPLLAALAPALAGCGSEPTTPPLTVAGDPLRVAASAEAGTLVVVDARDPRTHIGHFLAGQRVQISVVDAQWTNAAGPVLYDTRGAREQRCQTSGIHVCIGQGAPLMGLVLITVSDGPAEPIVAASACSLQHRLYIPNGVEFTVPVDSELSLGPNDWEDGLFNNAGAIAVLLERSSSKTDPNILRTSLTVGATSARTFVGRFSRGEYVRMSVTGGRWNHDPSAPLIDSAGFRGQNCGASGHVCVGGEGVPLMGLVLLLSSCEGKPVTSVREPRTERAYIPQGAEVVLANDADLYLAPNDWEDGLADNSGSARVRVRSFPK